jgi:hypothetical protein
MRALRRVRTDILKRFNRYVKSDVLGKAISRKTRRTTVTEA